LYKEIQLIYETNLLLKVFYGWNQVTKLL